MGCLGCSSVSLSTTITTSTRCSNLTVLATLSDNPIQTPESPTPKKPNPAGVGGMRLRRNGAVKTPKQKPPPSIAEIERAIGTGIYRDTDPTTRDSGESSTIFNRLLSNEVGSPEGSVEKKLQETGKWLIDSTKGTSRSAGQEILLVVSLWILPMWMFLLFVASGVIKLPSGIPFLDDLIM